MTHKYLLTLADGTVGLGWVGISTSMPHGHLIFEHRYLPHIYSINFLIIATPLSCVCQQHLLGLCVLLQLVLGGIPVFLARYGIDVASVLI